jgi:hypothetical protein
MAGTSTVAKDRGLRWGGIGGIVFAVAFVVGVLMMTDTPEGDESNREWIGYYADSGNRTQILIGAIVLAVGTIGFLAFVSSLRERIRGSEAQEWLGTLMLMSSVAFVTLLGVFGTSLGAVAAAVEFGDAPVPRSADIPRIVESIGFGALLLFGMAAAGLLMVTVSAAGARTALLPRWLVVTGYIAGVIVIVGGLFFIPMALLVLWVLAVSIVMLRYPSLRPNVTV